MGSFTAFLGGSLVIAIFSIHNSKLWQIFPFEGRSQGGESPSDALMKMDMEELLDFATKTIGKEGVEQLFAGDFSKFLNKDVFGEGEDVLKNILNLLPEGTYGKKLNDVENNSESEAPTSMNNDS